MIINRYRSGITGEQIDEWTIKCLSDAVGKGGIDLLEQNGYIVKSGIYEYETFEEMAERCSWQELTEKRFFYVCRQEIPELESRGISWRSKKGY